MKTWRITEGHSIKSWISRTHKNSSSERAKKRERIWLTHRSLQNRAKNKKAATKVVNKKLHGGINTRKTYNIKRLRDFHWE